MKIKVLQKNTKLLEEIKLAENPTNRRRSRD